MTKKRKKKAKKRLTAADRTSRSPRPGLGFDFGCVPNAMALGVYDFPSDLSNASIIGVAYGFAWAKDVGRSVPVISLIAENEEPLAKAFSTFRGWADATDPDSLELTIVFRRRGGYLLALSPEHSRLQRRCLGFDRTHRVILMAMTWCKPIDTVSPFLRKLREYARSPVAPFLLGGAVHRGRSLTAESSDPALLPASGGNNLLKFEITFVEESDVKPGTAAWVALQMVSSKSASRPRGKASPPSPPEIANERVRMLRTHFPTTLERLRLRPDFKLLCDGLVADGIAAWQVEQAICNLVLARSMNLANHYLGLPGANWQDTLLQALGKRYETADGDDKMPAFGIEAVRNQVLLDVNALLGFVGKRPVKDLPTARSALRAASMHQAGTAMVELPRSDEFS